MFLKKQMKNDLSPVTIDNKSNDNDPNDQMNVGSIEEEIDEQSNSHTEVNKSNKQENDKRNQTQNQKKIQTQKKIKKQKKQFCVSQNPSPIQLQTPVSMQETYNQQKEGYENLFNLQLNASNNNLFTCSNFKQSLKNSSQSRNQCLSNQANINNCSTPQKDKYQDILQSNSNVQYYFDSFFNKHRSTNQKGNCYNLKQKPNPFVADDKAYEQLETQFPISSLHQMYQEYQLQNSQGQLNEQISSSSQSNYNQILSNSGINIQKLNNKIINNQIINYNDKQSATGDQHTLIQENADEFFSINQESNSNSKLIKKGKKFQSVIYIDGDKKFQCQICKKIFDSKQKLGGHKARSHPYAPCQRTEREQKKKKKNQETAKSTNNDNSIDKQQQLQNNQINNNNNIQSQRVIEEKIDSLKILSQNENQQYQQSNNSQILEFLQNLSQNTNKSQQPKNGFKYSNPQSQQSFNSRNLMNPNIKSQKINIQNCEKELFNQLTKQQIENNQSLRKANSENLFDL